MVQWRHNLLSNSLPLLPYFDEKQKKNMPKSLRTVAADVLSLFVPTVCGMDFFLSVMRPNGWRWIVVTDYFKAVVFVFLRKNIEVDGWTLSNTLEDSSSCGSAWFVISALSVCLSVCTPVSQHSLLLAAQSKKKNLSFIPKVKDFLGGDKTKPNKSWWLSCEQKWRRKEWEIFNQAVTSTATGLVFIEDISPHLRGFFSSNRPQGKLWYLAAE